MSPITPMWPFKSIIRLTTLCCLLSIASCNEKCSPRPWHSSDPFSLKLKKGSKHLTGKDSTIRFKVVQNGTDSPSNGNLVLHLTRKEGHSAVITGKNEKEINKLDNGLFEYVIDESTINNTDGFIEDLCIKMEDEEEKKAAFELQLVYNGTYLGKPKKIDFDNRDVRLAITKLEKKLVGGQKEIPSNGEEDSPKFEERAFDFTIKSKGKDLPDEKGELSVVFTRKEGHQTKIEGPGIQPSKVPDKKDTGTFVLPITGQMKSKSLSIKDLKLIIPKGETRVVYEVNLIYKGNSISKPQQLIWEARNIELSLKKVKHELRGKNKTITFRIGIKGGKVDEINEDVILRITRKGDTNSKAKISGAEPKGEAGTFELALSKDDIIKGMKNPIDKLEIEVVKGDTFAEFMLQLVLGDLNTGKPQFVRWRKADVKLELDLKKKKLIGEEQTIEFSIKDIGKDRPGEEVPKENDHITLKIMRLADTNAQIKGATEISAGVYELSINKHKDFNQKIDTLSITTEPGDKMAKFSLQLFYQGMPIGKPKTVTWEAKNIKLKLTYVTSKLIGRKNNNRNIKFTISKKGTHDPEEGKSLLVRFTRKEGYEAKIKNIKLSTTALVEGEQQWKSVEPKGHGIFELHIPSGNIGNSIERVKIKPRKGEVRAEFSIQLIYDGIAMDKPKTIVWEAEKPQISIENLSNHLRGDEKQITFMIRNNNKAKEKPEKDELFLRIIREKGYNAQIVQEGVSEQEGDISEEKENIFNLKINLGYDPAIPSDLDKMIDKLKIITRPGETEAKFKLQLVYDGIEIGKPQKLVWVQKDIRIGIKDLSDKLQGDNKNIKFNLVNEGKDVPEENKLYIKFARVKGHKAVITRNGQKLDEKGQGFFESLITGSGLESSNKATYRNEEFSIEPREGERKVKFKLQLVYDGKELGKPHIIVWKEKTIGLSMKVSRNLLRGHDEENTTIEFKIDRNRKGNKEENKLETGKLFVRFSIKGSNVEKGSAEIVAKDQEVTTGNLHKTTEGIFEFPIDITHIGNPLKYQINPHKSEKEVLIKAELVYDGKKASKVKTIKWTTEDIRPTLHIEKHKLQGTEEKDWTINFKVTNEGKSELKENNVVVARLKRKSLDQSTIKLSNRPGIESFRLSKKRNFFEYIVNNKSLTYPIEDLVIVPPTSGELCEFEIQLFLDGFPVGNPQKIVCENTTQKERLAEEKRKKKEEEKQQKEEEKRKKKEEKERKKQEEEERREKEEGV